jgi:hypothetical protein
MADVTHSVGLVKRRLKPFVIAILVSCAPPQVDAAETPLNIDNNSFHCITEMTHIRHFYVDNLLGNLAATVAAAEKGTEDYPVGSVLQLVPNEVMVKLTKGTSPVTRDWAFFYVDVSESGTTIKKRGYVDVQNRFGGNCFACHSKARTEFDFVCEQNHGCAPLPLTEAMIGAVQRTDPRCRESRNVTPQDAQALTELNQLLESLTGAR